MAIGDAIMEVQKTNIIKNTEEVIVNIKKTLNLMAELMQIQAVVLKISDLFYLTALSEGQIINDQILNIDNIPVDFNPEMKMLCCTKYLLEWPDGSIFGELSLYNSKDFQNSYKLNVQAENLKDIIESYLKNIFLTENLIKIDKENQERTKELKCLFEITDLLTKKTDLEQLLYSIVEIVPMYLQFPEQSNACIIYQDQEYKSKGFKESEKIISAPLVVNNFTEGKIVLNYNEFYYSGILEFLPEEINLLQNIADQISTIIEKKKTEIYLVESRNKISTTLNSIGDGVITTDKFGFITRLNPVAEKLTGWNSSEAIDKQLTQVFNIINARTGDIADDPVQKVLNTGEIAGLTNDTILIAKDGTRHYISDSAAPVKNEYGETTDVILVFSDVTKQYENRKILAEKEEQLRSLAESAHAILWEYNIITDNWDYVAPQAEDILGFTPEEWTDLDFWKNRIHPDDQNWAIEYCFACTKKGDDHIFEYRFMTKSSKVVWLRDEVKVVIEDGEPVKLRGFMLDITERKNKEEQIQYISYHDSLTGCYNRTFLEEEIKRLDTERQLPISIILADINGLKIINDSYGHLKGDELLIKAAELIKKSTRKEDLVTRWGGDEFVIMLPQTGKEAAQKLYNRIKKECELEKGIPLSLGLGLATKENSDQDIYEILKQADMYMYKNKLLERTSSKSKIVKSLLDSLGAKSNETEDHALRMTKLAFDFGVEINLSNEEINKLSLLASLHDIGKTSVSEKILNKPENLSEEEWEIIRQHPERGHKIASASEEFVVIAKEILSHHERWDGKGYPKGLKGQEIPYLSRIISIIDAYDVMTTGRPYKERMSREEALAEIERCSGSQFDPDLAKEFVEMMTD